MFSHLQGGEDVHFPEMRERALYSQSQGNKCRELYTQNEECFSLTGAQDVLREMVGEAM